MDTSGRLGPGPAEGLTRCRGGRHRYRLLAQAKKAELDACLDSLKGSPAALFAVSAVRDTILWSTTKIFLGLCAAVWREWFSHCCSGPALSSASFDYVDDRKIPDVIRFHLSENGKFLRQPRDGQKGHEPLYGSPLKAERLSGHLDRRQVRRVLGNGENPIKLVSLAFRELRYDTREKTSGTVIFLLVFYKKMKK